MRYWLVGLMISVLAWGTAYAEEMPADEVEVVATAEVEAAWASSGPSKTDVTGIPPYVGPSYSSLESARSDVNNMPPEFHAFQHRPAHEVGFGWMTPLLPNREVVKNNEVPSGATP